MDLTLFNYHGKDVRVVMDKDGNPWWVAKDVCGVLGYANPRDVVKRLVRPQQKRGVWIPYPSGNTEIEVKAINEGGLYRLIMKSSKKEAIDFQDWVTDTVLPSIRKTGSYQHEPKSNTELIAMLATNAVEHEKEVKRIANVQVETNKRVDKVDDKVEYVNHKLEEVKSDLAPRVEKYEKFVNADGIISYKDASTVLGTGPIKLVRAFVLQKYMFRRGGKSVPYQKYIDKKLFDCRLVPVQIGRETINKPQWGLTPDGLDYFVEKAKSGAFEVR